MKSVRIFLVSLKLYTHLYILKKKPFDFSYSYFHKSRAEFLLKIINVSLNGMIGIVFCREKNNLSQKFAHNVAPSTTNFLLFFLLQKLDSWHWISDRVILQMSNKNSWECEQTSKHVHPFHVLIRGEKVTTRHINNTKALLPAHRLRNVCKSQNSLSNILHHQTAESTEP